MRVRLLETRLGLRNSTTRLPFRYGSACLTRCPQAVLSATVEWQGQQATGYSGDCFPPGWFDKSPDKDFAEQIDDMLAVIKMSEKTFAEELSFRTDFFPAWLAAGERVHSRAREWGLTPLLASFGVSFLERAVMDAALRASSQTFFDAAKANFFGMEPAEVHGELSGISPDKWLPDSPVTSIFVRHTVGLGDPLTTADIPADERRGDGLPQSLEEYIQRTGLRYLKVKVSNDLERDMQRLRTIAELIERHRGDNYRVTLDGNEQYKQASEFDELIDAISNSDRLRQFWSNLLVVEQPLERSIALDERHTDGIRRLSQHKPVIIDESDGNLDSYPRALEIGYRGVSSKNCKGPLKSLLNAGLTWLRNERGARSDFVMTGEDLCTVGVVPVQSDLCLVAALGLTHVERNGHHYHPGLSYLPAAAQQQALEKHGDLYARQRGIVAPNLVDGHFSIGSLQCVGFGFSVLPDMDQMTPADDWDFDSLFD